MSVNVTGHPAEPAYQDGAMESSRSGISWAAVWAGGVAACAITLLLMALGSGLGLTAVSPWSNSGVTATTFAVSAAIWLILVQWVSSAVGGYLAGRLRTKWVGVRTDEIFFRDTAHGFLAWGIATLVTVGVLTSAASGLVRTATQAVGGATTAAVQGAAQAAGTSSSSFDPTTYLVDTMFRSERANPAAGDQDVKTEAGRILLNSARTGTLDPADRTYLAQLVATRTGIPQQDAEKRIDDATAKAKDAASKAKEAADEARKNAARLSFFTFFSMLIGAFIACAAGALGGSLRDD
jgi:hypothetical protein